MPHRMAWCCRVRARTRPRGVRHCVCVAALQPPPTAGSLAGGGNHGQKDATAPILPQRDHARHSRVCAALLSRPSFCVLPQLERRGTRRPGASSDRLGPPHGHGPRTPGLTNPAGNHASLLYAPPAHDASHTALVPRLSRAVAVVVIGNLTPRAWGLGQSAHSAANFRYLLDACGQPGSSEIRAAAPYDALKSRALACACMSAWCGVGCCVVVTRGCRAPASRN